MFGVVLSQRERRKGLGHCNFCSYTPSETWRSLPGGGGVFGSEKNQIMIIKTDFPSFFTSPSYPAFPVNEIQMLERCETLCLKPSEAETCFPVSVTIGLKNKLFSFFTKRFWLRKPRVQIIKAAAIPQWTADTRGCPVQLTTVQGEFQPSEEPFQRLVRCTGWSVCLCHRISSTTGTQSYSRCTVSPAQHR